MKTPNQPPISKFMTLTQAGQIWLASKTRECAKPKTLECSKGHLKALLQFFGDILLHQINAGSLIAYQTKRSQAVGPSAVNHELNALSQILRLALCWGRISDSYTPLGEPEWQKPKTFTPQEQQVIFEHAKGDPELELAEIVFTISRNTGVSGVELRLARFGDVNLDSRPFTFHVTGDTRKHDIHPRLVPLNAEAEAAFRRAQERAYRLGLRRTDQFLFPFRVSPALYDANRPASKGWLRKQTQVLRERTGVSHLRPQLWRDQLCTEMLEQGIRPENVIGVMGRVSEKMLDAYKHTRLEAKQEALGVARGNLVAFPGQSSAQR